MLTDGLEWCGLLWCYISCLDSHSDGTHSLQRIHWWASDVMLHFSKSDEETNSSTSWMTCGWGHYQQIYIFGWTIPLNILIILPTLANQTQIDPQIRSFLLRQQLKFQKKPKQNQTLNFSCCKHRQVESVQYSLVLIISCLPLQGGIF